MAVSRTPSQSSRTKQLWGPDKPYNEIPLLPPKVDLETKAILKQCIQARAALAELKGAAELIPNPSILINTLPLLEAQASSEIENILTTTDRLFQFRELNAQADPATKEALRYSRALLDGYQAVQKRRLTTRTAEEICSRIKGVQMQVRRVPCTALANERTGEIVYTPPEGEDLLRSLLANWERFLHETTDLDPLIRMAVAHYQFEAIHPFTDGNGRTGRIINILYLVDQGLLDQPVLYLSRHIIQNKAAYYEGLRSVTEENAWINWIMYILEAVERTAQQTLQTVLSITELM